MELRSEKMPYFYSIQTQYILFIQIAVMIYMRDKKDKKKQPEHTLTKRLILDQIKHKLTQNQCCNHHHPLHVPVKDEIKKISKVKQPVLQQISPQLSRNNNISENQSKKLYESAVIKDNSHVLYDNQYTKRKSKLYIQSCFDVQVINLINSAQQMDTYMKLVEKYKEQTNKLSTQNQQLIKMLTDMEKSRQKYYSELTTRKEEEKLRSPQNNSYCQTQAKETNSVEKIEGTRSPLDNLDKIEETHEFQEEQYWKQELNSKESRIKNLQIEKQYLADQMMALQKDLQQLQNVFKQVNNQRQKAENEVKNWRIKCERLQKQVQLNEVELNAINDQYDLQKSRIRHLQEKSTPKSFNPSPMTVKSRYIQLPETQTNVTVEIVLKFLKRKQLIKYHQALMELINRYEIQLSELKANYMQQRQLKDRFLKYSQKIYSMILPLNNVSLEELTLAISKYELQIKHLKENQIDILLRKVKCFSIGIDHQEFQNIKMELEEYVYQLQARLPSLSEQYFQDGSSVADSHQVSLQI